MKKILLIVFALISLSSFAQFTPAKFTRVPFGFYIYKGTDTTYTYFNTAGKGVFRNKNGLELLNHTIIDSNLTIYGTTQIGATIDSCFFTPNAGNGMRLSAYTTYNLSKLELLKKAANLQAVIGNKITSTLALNSSGVTLEKQNNVSKSKMVLCDDSTYVNGSAKLFNVGTDYVANKWDLKVYGNTYLKGTLTANGATTLTSILDVTGNSTLHSNIYTDTCSGTGGNATYGVVYRGGLPFIHDFRHLTGNTARPVGKNIFIGESAGNFTLGSTATSVIEGSYNIGIGDNSGKSLTSGFRNMFIGSESGRFITSTGYNIFIGYQTESSSGRTATSNSTIIGSLSITNANSTTNQIILGYSVTGHGSNIATFGNASIIGWYAMRQTTANTSGTNLLIQSSGATVGSTDKNGGMLSLAYGQSTGTGLGSLRLQRRLRAASTGTTDNLTSDAVIVPSENNMVDNVDKNLFEVALAADAGSGGEIAYTIVATNGDTTDVRTGKVLYALADGNATVLSTIEESDGVAKSVPDALTDMVVTWTATPSGGTKVIISAKTDISFIATAIKIHYTIINNGTTAITQL